MTDDERARHKLRKRGNAAASKVSSNHGSAEDHRSASRLKSEHPASVRIRNVKYTVELCDVSPTGAQVRIRQGLIPTVGQDVELQFMNDALSTATVMWVEGPNVGLKFNEPLPDCSDVLHFDDLGSEYYRAILKLQSFTT